MYNSIRLFTYSQFAKFVWCILNKAHGKHGPGYSWFNDVIRDKILIKFLVVMIVPSIKMATERNNQGFLM